MTEELAVVVDKRLISDALTQLSPGHRDVIWRAHYLGWSTGQIAGDLRITEACVKCRLHEALHEFRLTVEGMTRGHRRGLPGSIY